MGVQVVSTVQLTIINLFSPAIDATNLEPPLDDEIKDGQWLGVSLQSQGIGGKVMVSYIMFLIF